MSPPRMAPLTAVFFLLLSIFSAAIARSELPQIALPESGPQSISTEISFSNSNSNQNPRPEQDSEIVRWLEFTKVEEDDSKTADLHKPDLVAPEFPVLNRHRPLRLRHRRGCGHGRRFSHQDRNRQIGYGNDMIASDERTNRPDDFKISSVEFDPHQHGIRSVSLDKTEFKGPFLHHHHHYDDDDDLEHQVKNLEKFSWDKHTPREFDHGHDHHHNKRPPFDRDGEEDWQPHHHHHRHHHPHGQDHGGLMILERLRKFLYHF